MENQKKVILIGAREETISIGEKKTCTLSLSASDQTQTFALAEWRKSRCIQNFLHRQYEPKMGDSVQMPLHSFEHFLRIRC